MHYPIHLREAITCSISSAYFGRCITDSFIWFPKGGCLFKICKYLVYIIHNSTEIRKVNFKLRFLIRECKRSVTNSSCSLATILTSRKFNIFSRSDLWSANTISIFKTWVIFQDSIISLNAVFWGSYYFKLPGKIWHKENTSCSILYKNW